MDEEVQVPAEFGSIVDEVEALLRRSHEAGVSFSQAVAEAEDRFLNEPRTPEDATAAKTMDMPMLRGLGEAHGSPPSWRLDVDTVRSWWRGDERLAVISDRQLNEAIVFVHRTSGETVDDSVYALGLDAIESAYATRLRASE